MCIEVNAKDLISPQPPRINPRNSLKHKKIPLLKVEVILFGYIAKENEDYPYTSVG